MVRNENAAIRNVRTEIVGGAAGRVLEVGCGPGSNFAYYGDSIRELIATHPAPLLLGRAGRRASGAGPAARKGPEVVLGEGWGTWAPLPPAVYPSRPLLVAAGAGRQAVAGL